MERVTTWSIDEVLDLVRAQHDPDIAEAVWIGSGHWSDCFAFASGGRDHVVRIGRHGEDFRKDAAAAAYRRPGLPIPAVSKIGRVGGDWFAVSERVHGEPLEQADGWSGLVTSVADLLEGLRAVDVAATTGWGRWNGDRMAPAAGWRGFLLDVDQDRPDSRTHGWKQKLASHPTAERAFAAGYERLQLAATNDVPRSLVHNDLVNRNTHVRSGVITGVFDWGNSLFGDHLYDLALFCFWQPWLPKLKHRAVIAELKRRWSVGDDVPNFAPRFQTCLLHIGLEHIAYNTFLGSDSWSEIGAICDRMDAVVGTEW